MIVLALFAFASLQTRSKWQQTLNSQKKERKIFLCKDRYLQPQKVKASFLLNLCEHYIIYGQLSQFSQARLLLRETGKNDQSEQKRFNLFSHSSVVQTDVLHSTASL